MCVPWVNTCEVLPLVSSSPGCVAVGQWSSGVSRTLRPWLSVQRTTDVACYLSPSPRGDETPALNWPSQGLPHTCTTFIISNKNDYHKSEIIVAIKYFYGMIVIHMQICRWGVNDNALTYVTKIDFKCENMIIIMTVSSKWLTYCSLSDSISALSLAWSPAFLPINRLAMTHQGRGWVEPPRPLVYSLLYAAAVSVRWRKGGG